MSARLKTTILFAAGVAPFFVNGWYNPRLAARPAAFWAVEILTWIVAPAALVAAGLRAGLFTAADLGLNARVRGRARPFALALLLVAVPFALYHLDQWASATARGLFAANYGVVPFRYNDMVPPPGPDTGWWRILALAHLCLTAGFTEEIFYRGLLARAFGAGSRAAVAYMPLSAVIFSAAHWEGGVYVLWEAFVFGVAAAAVFRLTRNLWPLIVAHAIIDLGWFSQ